MNILYLAHRIPFPPDKGDKIRSFRQLSHLAERHCVRCAFFVDDPSDIQHVDTLRDICEDVVAVPLRRLPAASRGLWGLARGQTFTESAYRSPAMRDAIVRWCDDAPFDVVVAFSSSMAAYALDVPAKRRVLDLCDLDSAKWLDYAVSARGPARTLYRTEGTRLARRERAWMGRFDATLLITEAEARPLADDVHRDRVHVVGNGVSLPVLPTERPRAGRTVGFVGVMDYRPNVDAVCWFVSACWPQIRAAVPGAEFRIVGRSPTRRVRRLALMPGVEVVGGVDDVGDELHRFDVSVAPLRIARGLQNKVLEAMAWARPTVLTTRAAEGIEARDQQEYLTADSSTQIVRAVTQLLCDPVLCRRIGAAARRFVADRHRWDDILRRFELIVTGAMTRTAQATTLMPQGARSVVSERSSTPTPSTSA